jgi:hypothetical protein
MPVATPAMPVLLLSEQFKVRFNIFRHDVLGVPNGSRWRGTALPLRFKFLLTDAVHKVVQGFSTIAKFNLKAVTLVSLASTT